MDRMRPMYAPPQKSIQNPSNSGAPSSPGTTSPVHHGHTRSGSISNARKPQNTKAAAQRLAQVMAHQTTDDDDDDEDLLCDPGSVSLSAGIGLAGGRSSRNRSPMSVRASMEQSVSVRSAQRRASPSPSEQQSPSARSYSATRSSQLSSVEHPSSSTRSTLTIRSSQLSSSAEQSPAARSISTTRTPQLSSAEEQSSLTRSFLTTRSAHSSTAEQPSSARSFQAGRSFQPTNSADPVQPLSAWSSHHITPEQPPSARSTSASRPNLGVKTVPIVPSTVPISLRTAIPSNPYEHQSERRKDKRLSLDFGTFKHNEPTSQTSSSALQDELDMLQEENESLLEKLRLAEDRFEEAEARAKQLEKQVANLGEGVSLDARLLSRQGLETQQYYIQEQSFTD